jgi:hypothetical protein
LQRELKSSRISTTFAQDWDNFDLFLNGNLATEGRLYTAPEHYDQALRFGFKAYISLTGRCLFVLSTFLGFILSMFDARLSLVLAVPLVLLWYIMGERARLRAKVWEAVESVMTARDAKRF